MNAGYKFAHPKVVRPLWFQCNRFFYSITSSRKVLTVVSSQLARSVDICFHVYSIGYDERSTDSKEQIDIVITNRRVRAKGIQTYLSRTLGAFGSMVVVPGFR